MRLVPSGAQPPRQLQVFLDAMHWLSLDELDRQPDLDPLLNQLTLPVETKDELPASNRQILQQRPDLLSAVLTVLIERLPTLTPTSSRGGDHGDRRQPHRPAAPYPQRTARHSQLQDGGAQAAARLNSAHPCPAAWG